MNSVDNFVRKYVVLTKRGLGVLLEYRGSMLIWIISGSFPLVMLAVWLSLAQDGPIAGYTAGDFVAYYLLVLYVRQMTAVWVAWEVEYDIRHGDMNSKLLQPIHPLHQYFSTNIADKIIRGIMFTPLIFIVAWLVPGVSIAGTPLNIALFIITLAGAWMMRYLIQFVMGLGAFWFSQTMVLTEVFWLCYLLFGGGVAPLDLMPEPLRSIGYVAPFRLMMQFPIDIMMGRLSMNDILIGLGEMAAWFAVILIAYRLVWARGIRKFGAFGA